MTLTATPSPTSVFTGWSGACSGKGACVVAMDAAQAVTATFVPGYSLVGLHDGRRDRHGDGRQHRAGRDGDDRVHHRIGRRLQRARGER